MASCTIAVLISYFPFSIKLKLYDELLLTRDDLPDKYQAIHVSFHWGSSNSHGSEHLADGKPYPMEVTIKFIFSEKKLFFSEIDKYFNKNKLILYLH